MLETYKFFNYYYLHFYNSSTAVREAHCAQATVARLVTFESLKWKYSVATNSAIARCEQASTAVREAHCAQATVARFVTFESLKWKYSFATNSALFMKLGSLLYVRCRHRSAKSTAISNKTFLFQVTNIYLFCRSVTLST